MGRIPKSRKFSAAEWDVLAVLWDLGRPATVREVHEHGYPKNEKAYTTIQTILNIMVRKRLLERRKVGLVNYYRPKEGRLAIVRAETTRFVERVFGGSVGALVNHLMDSESLSRHEVESLKQRIEQPGSSRQRKGPK